MLNICYHVLSNELFLKDLCFLIKNDSFLKPLLFFMLINILTKKASGVNIK